MFIILFLAASLAADAPAEPTAPPPGSPAAVAGSAPQAQPAATAAVPGKVAAAKKGDVVCRNEAVLGTRFPQRVCRSRAAMEARSRDDRQVIETIQGGAARVHGQ